MVGTDRHRPRHDDPAPEHAHALAAIGRDYPPWHAWTGVLAGILYASRPGTSPPMVVRAVTLGGLRAEIERAETERGLRPAPPGNAISTDLDSLRDEFTGTGWAFGSLWASAATGPDPRRLYASRNGVLITSWTAAELRTKVQHEQANE